MRRLLLAALAAALVTAGCRAPAAQTPARPALLVSVTRSPRTPTGTLAAGEVFLVKDGSARRLFTSAPDIETALSPDGRWLLHAAETSGGPFVRELRLYDLATLTDAGFARGTFVSLGWAGDRPLGVTARVSKGGGAGSHGWTASDYAYTVYYTPRQLEELRLQLGLLRGPNPVSLASTVTPAHLSFLTMDRQAPYFIGDDGIYRAEPGARAGMAQAWSFGQRIASLVPEHSARETPLPDAGIPRSSLARVGLPMMGWLFPSKTPGEESLVFRRLGDGTVRRRVTIRTMRTSATYPLVLAPDASRYLQTERSGSTTRKPLGQVIAEYDAKTGGRTVLVTASHAERFPVALGYVGEDVAYWSLQGDRADIWLWQRSTRTARKLATLPAGIHLWADGPRLVGVEYAR